MCGKTNHLAGFFGYECEFGAVFDRQVFEKAGGTVQYNGLDGVFFFFYTAVGGDEVQCVVL